MSRLLRSQSKRLHNSRTFLFSARRYATPVEFEQPERDPQLADYPQLPAINAQRRNPRGWWDQQERRNFGETLHEQSEGLSMWSPDVFNITRSSALFQFSLSVLAFLGFAGVVYITLPDRPAVPRSYPYSGLVKELGGVEENAAPAESLEEEAD